MLLKRLVGVVTVRRGIAVQSFGYRRWLPLGRPEVLVENLDRWGVDEILLQCIDRSAQDQGPDFALLDRIGRLGLSTPLTYAGGIRHVQDAVLVVQRAADRVAVDALLRDNLPQVRAISQRLGAQAVVAALPLSLTRADTAPPALAWRDYRHRVCTPLPATLPALLREGPAPRGPAEGAGRAPRVYFTPSLIEPGTPCTSTSACPPRAQKSP